MKRFGILTIGICLLLAGCAPADDTPRATAGDGGAGKLFVDVAVDNYIQVIDLGTKETIDKIVVGEKPHGLVYKKVTAGGRQFDLIFVTVEIMGELVVVDAWSHEILGRVRVGEIPNELTITRDDKFAYIPIRNEAKAAIVELNLGVANGKVTADPKLLKTLDIGEAPHNSYTGEASGLVYMTTIQGETIHIFDPETHDEVGKMKFPGPVRPVALTKDESKAYVALSGLQGFVVADMKERKVTDTVRLPDLPEGTPVPYLNTYVHGVTLSPDESEVWFANCPGSAVYAYSTADLKLVAKVEVGAYPHWFTWQPPMADGKTNKWLLWVSEMDSNTVSAIDPDTREIVATVPTGPQPRRIVVVPPKT